MCTVNVYLLREFINTVGASNCIGLSCIPPVGYCHAGFFPVQKPVGRFEVKMCDVQLFQYLSRSVAYNVSFRIVSPHEKQYHYILS